MQKILFVVLTFFMVNLATAQDSELALIDKFFEVYKTNSAEALDYLASTNPWIRLDGEQSLKVKLTQVEGLLGEYMGKEFLYRGELGDSYVTYIYFAKYERQPLRWTIHLYKPKDTWMAYSFTYDDNFDDEFEEMILINYMNDRY